MRTLGRLVVINAAVVLVLAAGMLAAVDHYPWPFFVLIVIWIPPLFWFVGMPRGAEESRPTEILQVGDKT